MGAKGGGAVPGAAQNQVVRQLRVQQSVLGAAIPIYFGTQRVAGNVVWAGEFVAIPSAAPSAAKGGGRVAQVTYVYEASIIIALGEGPCFQLASATPGRQVEQTLDGNGQVIPSASFSPGVWVTKKTKRATVDQERPRAEFWPFNGYRGGAASWPTGAPFTDDDGDVDPTLDTLNVNRSAFAIVQGVLPPPDLREGTSGAYWTYLYGHPRFGANGTRAQHLVYPGVAYVAGKLMPLDSNASLPNFNFPLIGHKAYFLVHGLPQPDDRQDELHRVSGIGPETALYDAAVHDVVSELLTNQVWGVPAFAPYLDADAFDSAKPNTFAAYCLANDILISPAYDSQRTAASVLEELAEIANAAWVWSEGRLKIISYGDGAATSTLTGKTFDPGTITAAPVGASNTGTFLLIRADLTDADFLPMGEDDGPLIVDRKSDSDVYTRISIEYENRLNAYSPDVAEATDAAGVASRGGAVRAGDAKKIPAIKREELARDTAQRALQSQLNRRNIYRFKLGWTFVLLEPMDVVTVTDSALGLFYYPVRLIEIVETDDGSFDVEAIDVPIGVRTARRYPIQPNAGFTLDYNTPAGQMNPPAMFEAPFTMADGQLVLYIALSGDNNWGGASLFFSTDGVEYRSIGGVSEPAVHGYVLASTLTDTVPQGAVDGIGTLDVALYNKGVLPTATKADADALTSACVVGTGTTFELLAYSAANYTGLVKSLSKYRLGPNYIRRGVHYTSPRVPVAGDQFALLSTAVTVPLDPALIGTVVYLKVLPHNPYGGGQPDLTEVDPIMWTVSGVGLLHAPGDVVGARSVFQDAQVALTWDTVIDPRGLTYEIRRGAAWDTAMLVATTTTPRYRIDGGGTYWIASRVSVPTGHGPRVVYSAEPAQITVQAALFVSNVVQVADEAAPGWPGGLTRFPARILGDRSGPLLYWRGSVSPGGLEVDWSGHGTIPTSGSGVTRVTGLLRDDADQAYSFNGTDGFGAGGSYLASPWEARGLLNRLGKNPKAAGSAEVGHGFIVGCIFQRGSIVAAEQYLLSFSVGDATGAVEGIGLYLTTSHVLTLRYNSGVTVSTGILVNATNQVVFVGWRYGGGLTNADMQLVIGRRVGTTPTNDPIPLVLTFPAGSIGEPGRVIVGQRQNGTAAFFGTIDEILVQEAGDLTADLALLGDLARMARFSVTTTPAAAVVSAAVELAAGENAAAYYCPPWFPHALALQDDSGVRCDATLSAVAVSRYATVGAIPLISDMRTMSGVPPVESGTEAVIEIATADGPGYNGEPGRGRLGPWRKMEPGRYKMHRAKFRVRLSSPLPDVQLRATAAAVTVDVDDVVQQGTATVASAGVMRRIGSAIIQTGTIADVRLSEAVPASGAVNEHILVVVVQDVPSPASAVTDYGGNAYTQLAAMAPTIPAPSPDVSIHLARVTTALDQGRSVVVGNLLRSPALVQVFRCTGLATAQTPAVSRVVSSTSGVSLPNTLTPANVTVTGTQLVIAAFGWDATDHGVDQWSAARSMPGTLLADTNGLGVDFLSGVTWGLRTAGAVALTSLLRAPSRTYSALQLTLTLQSLTGYSRVPFPRRFNVAPELAVAVLDTPSAAAVPDVVELGVIDVDGFEVRVTSNGNVVTRSIGWVAQAF